jgi:hypothetical protein|tara:strand:+ start:231 stop:443 length:213 start_codon:yes stop_codon:yes gene_type:complete
MRNNLKPHIARLVQFFLGFEVLLHLLQVVSAYYEKAWTTFALTCFHTLLMIIAVYLVGSEHYTNNKNKWG